MKLDRMWILGASLFATVTLAGVEPALSRAPVSRDVQRKLDRWLESRALQGLSVGVAVADLDTGDLVASHRPEEVLNPASGAKLLTTAAALKRLGASHSWSTSFALQGSSLIVTGGGDPKLLPEEIAPLIEEVSKKLQGLKIKRLDAIRLDVSRYDLSLIHI